jgi:hypothetical protein
LPNFAKAMQLATKVGEEKRHLLKLSVCCAMEVCQSLRGQTVPGARTFGARLFRKAKMEAMARYLVKSANPRAGRLQPFV